MEVRPFSWNTDTMKYTTIKTTTRTHSDLPEEWKWYEIAPLIAAFVLLFVLLFGSLIFALFALFSQFL